MRKKLLDNVKVESNGCWIWKKHCQHWGKQYGYGMIWDQKEKKMKLTHRVSYEIFKGKTKNKCVLHKCDNPSCVNPDHLFLGSQADNVRDMAIKGRARKSKGVKHWKSKLSVKDVLDIRNSSLSLSKLAKKYNFSKSGIYSVKSGLLWRHV